MHDVSTATAVRKVDIDSGLLGDMDPNWSRHHGGFRVIHKVDKAIVTIKTKARVEYYELKYKKWLAVKHSFGKLNGAINIQALD